MANGKSACAGAAAVLTEAWAPANTATHPKMVNVAATCRLDMMASMTWAKECSVAGGHFSGAPVARPSAMCRRRHCLVRVGMRLMRKGQPRPRTSPRDSAPALRSELPLFVGQNRAYIDGALRLRRRLLWGGKNHESIDLQVGRGGRGPGGSRRRDGLGPRPAHRS